ncbi:hypothetical protein [Streptomyces hoynatensis]|uniref:Uncharacterized protein n=1 Tax=Streptomyces hoynatensis TaxID=1141874 RepID=A0A3A9YPU0_9ACTN|nr:hypothetical protein [Streptomyces hoynatensis]RKN38023.1 hypothetical protein D7294_25895 [Streptomyces hoynatensis]
MPNDEGNDRLAALLRAHDPVREDELPSAGDPVGLRVLDRARRRSRRARTRRLVLVPAATLAMTGATAGAYAWVSAPGQPTNSAQLTCVTPTSQVGVEFYASEGTPADLCRDMWQYYADGPAPESLTACVEADRWNSIYVYEGDAAECARHGQEPYTGVSDEQYRFSAFRAELEEADAGCVSAEELRAKAEELLAEHGLGGWTVETEPVGASPLSGPCEMVTGFDEETRTVSLAPWGDPLSPGDEASADVTVPAENGALRPAN